MTAPLIRFSPAETRGLAEAVVRELRAIVPPDLATQLLLEALARRAAFLERSVSDLVSRFEQPTLFGVDWAKPGDETSAVLGGDGVVRGELVRPRSRRRARSAPGSVPSMEAALALDPATLARNEQRVDEAVRSAGSVGASRPEIAFLTGLKINTVNGRVAYLTSIGRLWPHPTVRRGQCGVVVHVDFLGGMLAAMEASRGEETK